MFNFGEHLKNLRKSKGLTQKELSKKINISERGLQRYENNERKPTFESLIAIADFFNVSVDSLMGRDDDLQK